MKNFSYHSVKNVKEAKKLASSKSAFLAGGMTTIPAMKLRLASYSDIIDIKKIKDLSGIKGVRSNQLIGFGLVIGLTKTGDSAVNVFFSIQTIASMLKKLGVTIPSGRIGQLQFKNIATVIVTADLPPFAKHGDTIDVTVSSLGDSKSLQGGTLLMTPLKGPDNQTYAVAQGPIAIGGFRVPVSYTHLTLPTILLV